MDDEQERFDVIGAGDSSDSDEEQGLGSLAGLEPWEESGVESLNPLETRAGVAVRSPEDTIPAFASGRHVSYASMCHMRDAHPPCVQGGI